MSDVRTVMHIPAAQLSVHLLCKEGESFGLVVALQGADGRNVLEWMPDLRIGETVVIGPFGVDVEYNLVGCLKQDDQDL